MILRGDKTQTRRIWKKPMAKEGSLHFAKRRLFSDDWFARLRILKVREQRLGDMTEDEFRAEGYSRFEEFRAIWEMINGSWDPDLVVTVIEFEVVGVNGDFVRSFKQ